MAEVRRPSGTLMNVMTTLLKTVVLKLPRTQAPVKLPHSRFVGGAKALVPMTVEFALSAVKRMNTKGAIQMAAIAMRMIQRITSTGSTRLRSEDRKALANALMPTVPGECASI